MRHYVRGAKTACKSDADLLHDTIDKMFVDCTACLDWLDVSKWDEVHDGGVSHEGKQMHMGCMACGFECLLTCYRATYPAKCPDGAWLCPLCADTPSGNAFIYPRQYEADGNVLQMIAKVGNMILAELRKS